MWLTVMLVILVNSLFCSSCLLMMAIAGSIGMEVNRECTS